MTTSISNGDSGSSIRTKLNDIWEGLTINEISASKAETAVDVFVYDTSLDSDGGAWRKRCQHTSWYNETLNTATRGSRREFPAVAVIVAEADKVTIYDGDDPALPMWMVFNAGAYSADLLRAAGARSVAAKNGRLSFALGSTMGFVHVDFISDSGYLRPATANAGPYNGNISERNSQKNFSFINASGNIVDNTVNDVAMTVLPDAPIDPATGLPVPTIAVATAGGVSVIKDDGNVVDITSGGTLPTIGFDADNYIYVSDSNLIRHGAIPSSDTSLTSWSPAPFTATSVPAIKANTSKISKSLFGSASGLALVLHDKSNMAKSMVAYTTSTYNTGWMNGDIKGAFLSDTDDTDLVGSGELVTNGTFDTDTSGWTAARSATLTWVSGAMQISYGGTDYPQAQQTLTTVAGQRYKLQVTQTAGVSLSAVVGTAAGGNQLGSVVGTGSLTLDFVASSTTSYLTLQANSVGAISVTVDNISVKPADEDRSVNNNGLTVNGTVTRTPVATGAELVAYSGFSASNYLEQPYNSALDFGTGDFCVMGWVKPDATASRTFISYEGGEGWQLDNYASSLRFWEYTPAGGNKALASATASTALQFICVVVSGGVVSMYRNGALVSSGITTTRTFSNGTLRIGRGHSFLGYNALGSQLSLLRISATAPTAEQIKKIYEDEKVLFQENAACTLYGTSDAVTALAHDEDTGLLHVGTSAGRSVFQGLRRVSNTTTAVGTAISASNGLVVEE